MATVDELVKQYETDEKLQKEVADIVADGKITIIHWKICPSTLSRPESLALLNNGVF